MQERYSDLFFTINTHVKPVDDTETKELSDILESTLLEKFYTRDALNEVLLREEGATLTKVTLTNAGIEIGDTYHQLHIHFNLTVLHKGKLLLKNAETTLNKSTRDWWNSALPWERGCYARVDLLPSSKAKNYNLKQQQRGKASVADFTVGASTESRENGEDNTGTRSGDTDPTEGNNQGEALPESSQISGKD